MSTEISVVIPLYNKALHIGRALESIRAQTVPPQEIIVVDDGSTDGGGVIVTTFADPRIILYQQENFGVGKARNQGISLAKGELIAFLDADDAWKPNFLKAISRLYRKFPEAGIFATAFEVINPDGTKSIPTYDILPQNQEDGLIRSYVQTSLERIFKTSILIPSAVAIPKTVLHEVGGFPEDHSLTEDLDTWLRIGMRYPVAWTREHLATYIKNASNRIWEIKISPMEPAISITIRRAMYSGEINHGEMHIYKEYAARFQLMAVRDCLLAGRRELALQLLNYARGTKRFAGMWWKWRILAALPGKAAHYLWKLKKIMQLQLLKCK
jgi:glycosyltransferase involved in cell wall biosynthesis